MREDAYSTEPGEDVKKRGTEEVVREVVEESKECSFETRGRLISKATERL